LTSFKLLLASRIAPICPKNGAGRTGKQSPTGSVQHYISRVALAPAFRTPAPRFTRFVSSFRAGPAAQNRKLETNKKRPLSETQERFAKKNEAEDLRRAFEKLDTRG
jgi:hypothetical protein